MNSPFFHLAPARFDDVVDGGGKAEIPDAARAGLARCAAGGGPDPARAGRSR